MRFLIIILSLFLITSCGSLKNSTEVKPLKINQIDSSKVVLIDTLILDTIPIRTEPVYIEPDRLEVNRKVSNEEKAIRKPKSIDNIEKSNHEIIDNTINIDIKPSLGLVAHSVPKIMQVGKTYTVKLRISKERNKAQLIDGNGIPISDVRFDSKITISSIRVEPVMSAKLISDSSKMIIQSTSTLIQDIEKEGFTEWEWRLTPIKGGDIFLKIMVSVIVEDNKIIKDIPVYNDVVSVKSNISFTIKGFLNEYWQWLMTTIIIPLVVWFYNKKRKKDK